MNSLESRVPGEVCSTVALALIGFQGRAVFRKAPPHMEPVPGDHQGQHLYIDSIHPSRVSSFLIKLRLLGLAGEQGGKLPRSAGTLTQD